MKRLCQKILVLALSFFSLQLLADENVYVGLKVGVVDIDIPNSGSFGRNASGDETGVGLLVGYDFVGPFDVEFEYMETNVGSSDLGRNEVELDSMALYAVYRSVGTFYFKGKLGVLREEVSARGNYGNSASANDTGASAGIGGGYRFGDFAVEGEYTIIEEDVDFFSVGVNYQF